MLFVPRATDEVGGYKARSARSELKASGAIKRARARQEMPTRSAWCGAVAG